MTFTELKFSKYVRENFDGWSEKYEPGRGGGTGIPDLQLLVKYRLLPVELKLWGEPLRPVQHLWHRDFRNYGGCSAILEGRKEKRGVVDMRIRRWGDDTIGTEKNWTEINLQLKMFLNQWVPW